MDLQALETTASIISTSIAALKNATEILKTISGNAKATQLLEDRISELRSIVFDVREALATLQERNHLLASDIRVLKEENLELRAQLEEKDEWKIEKERYELIEWHGVMAYMLRAEFREEDKKSPAFCANCFQQKKLAPLHRAKQLHTFVTDCGACGFKKYVTPNHF